MVRGNEGNSYKGIKIRVGDVVVFHPLDREALVVHRVLTIDSDAIKTRGDNNSAPDPWVLEPKDIIGRITRAKRKNRTQKIYGGLPGRLYVSGVGAIKQVDLMVSRILHPAHR